MPVRPLRPEKIMHREEQRIENIAIKTGKAHSSFMDTVFPYAFWTLLIIMVIGLTVAILVW
jgi:hypothetical protein